MGLILKSFTLSFGVFGRMILPVLAIFVVSAIVSTLLNLISGGYADYVSGPITAAFMSLVGMRVAFASMGDARRADYSILLLYAVLYGILLLIAKGCAVVITDATALFYADWKLGDAISLRRFMEADRSVQTAFSLHALSVKSVMSVVLYTSIYVVMAVPMASAARSAGGGAKGAGFFYGFGRSFLPLFAIFALSFFVQFFFGLFSALFAVTMLALSIVTIIINQTLPDFDLYTILLGLAAGAGLLWLHSWVWAASAVACAKSDQGAQVPKPKAPAQQVDAPDLRALRKSRE